MAVKLIANYAKKLGLPGYSSHQFSISVETELTNVEDIAGTSERLYQQLQDAVDEQMQNYGYVPPDGYGMAPETDRAPRNGAAGNGTAPTAMAATATGTATVIDPRPAADRWNCTEGQKGLILRLVHEHQLDKNEVEAMAQQLFGCGVTAMDKMQASQLIEDLLEKVGKKPTRPAPVGKPAGGAVDDRDHRTRRNRASPVPTRRSASASCSRPSRLPACRST